MSNAAPTDADGIASGYLEWKNWAAEDFGRFSASEGMYFESEFGPLLNDCSNPVLLEVGFGNGSFLGWGLSRGLECCGIEIQPELVNRAELFGLKTYPAVDDPTLQLRSGEFDLVVAFDVLEHIDQSELVAYFRSVANLLKPGGHFVARFPNGDSPFGRVFQHGDLTHVSTLGQFKIKQLASIVGLRVVSFGQSARVKAGLRVAERFRIATGMAMRSAIDRLVSTLYFGGMKVSLSPNAVAVLQKRLP